MGTSNLEAEEGGIPGWGNPPGNRKAEKMGKKITKTKKTASAPSMPRIVAVSMFLKMEASPRTSEIFLTATRTSMKPRIPIRGPANGDIERTIRMEPTPPNHFAWESVLIGSMAGQV